MVIRFTEEQAFDVLEFIGLTYTSHFFSLLTFFGRWHPAVSIGTGAIDVCAAEH